MGSFTQQKIEKLIAKKNVKGLIKALSYPEDKRVRTKAAEALGQISDKRAVEPLIEAFKDNIRGVRDAAAKALVNIGAPAVEPLIAALRYKDSNTSKCAAEALGKISDTRAVAPLIVALRDKKPGVHIAVALALGKIGDTRAVAPLIVALRDKNPDVHMAAAWSLGEIGDASAVGPLITALSDKEDWHVPQAALEALEKIGVPAVESLIVALRDKEWLVRTHAARALGEIGDVRAVGMLVAALRDKHEYVRESAAKSLNKLGWQPNNGGDGAAYWVAQKEWDRCVKIGAPAVEPLIAALQYEDEYVRRAAAKALVSLYKSDSLDDYQKQTIFAMRNTIEGTSKPHTDYEVGSCIISHFDFSEDIVEFPL